jgi:hypothetical protein
MVKKPTIILLVLLAALALFAWWFEFSPSSAARKITPTTAEIARPLADWKFENTALMEYTRAEGSTLTLRLGKNITIWTIDEKDNIKADTGKVFQLMSELLAIQPLSKLETNIDEEAMGLGKNSNKLKLVDSSGLSVVLQFGSETPTKSGTYVKVGSGYYIINSPVIENIQPLLTVDGLMTPTQQSSPVDITKQP